MAKTLRTSGDYTIKTGTGAGGSNTVYLDSKTTRIVGDLVVDGSRTELNTATLSVEDKFIEVNRNNSTADTEDSGMFFNRGTSNAGLLYWDAGDDEFQLGTTTNAPSVTAISNITLANIKVATTPGHANHAASKSYVDSTATGFTLKVAGDDSTQVAVGTGNTIKFAGASGISTVASEPDTVTISLGSNLTNINSIDQGSSNGDLILRANGTGDVVINDTLTWSAAASDPTATTVTKVYNKTAGGGGTGIFFRNSNIGSGAVGELISKSKATALAIALG
jgi:hypothetical protein